MTSGTIPKYLEVSASMIVTLNDAPDDWLDRCFTEEWQAYMYRMKDEKEVYSHLAYNALVNDVDDISRLEGWADIEPGAVRLRVSSIDVDVFDD